MKFNVRVQKKGTARLGMKHGRVENIGSEYMTSDFDENKKEVLKMRVLCLIDFMIEITLPLLKKGIIYQIIDHINNCINNNNNNNNNNKKEIENEPLGKSMTQK